MYWTNWYVIFVCALNYKLDFLPDTTLFWLVVWISYYLASESTLEARKRYVGWDRQWMSADGRCRTFAPWNVWTEGRRRDWSPCLQERKRRQERYEGSSTTRQSRKAKRMCGLLIWFPCFFIHLSCLVLCYPPRLSLQFICLLCLHFLRR